MFRAATLEPAKSPSPRGLVFGFTGRRWIVLALCTLWNCGSVSFGATTSLTLTAQQAVVNKGDSTVLNWSSTGMKRCEASGAWSGSKPVSGSANTGPLSQLTTFVLTCTSRSGSTAAMLGIPVRDTVQLAWISPTTRTDGTVFDRRAGFRVYYGSNSRTYTSQERITNPDVTAWSIALPSGTYYFAVTALDLKGLESSQSNEVVRVIK